MTTLAVSETVSLSKMDSPSIVDHIVVTLSTSMVRTLEDLKPYILEIWRRLDEGEVIRFASDEYRTRKEFCSGVLGRTYRAVHYMLNDGNKNRSLPPTPNSPKRKVGGLRKPFSPEELYDDVAICLTEHHLSDEDTVQQLCSPDANYQGEERSVRKAITMYHEQGDRIHRRSIFHLGDHNNLSGTMTEEERTAWRVHNDNVKAEIGRLGRKRGSGALDTNDDQNNGISIRYGQSWKNGSPCYPDGTNPGSVPIARPNEDDDDSGLPHYWSMSDRESAEGVTLPALRAKIHLVASHLKNPRAVLGLGEPSKSKIPSGNTPAEALHSRQTLDIPAQFLIKGKLTGPTNVQWQNGAVLNQLLDAVRGGEDEAIAKVKNRAARTINTYPEDDYSESQIKATSRSHGPGLERLRKIARKNQTVSYSDDQFHILTRNSFDTESKARKFLKRK